MLQEHTIIPKVQAVNPTLTVAVSTSKNTFSHMAVGLEIGWGEAFESLTS
jgi:hypothetical protein